MRALRDAVAGGREGQAYLFSGPRGTGKTTTARILAKVLNCERPIDGEPCCECASCLDVERGVSYDVHELDAASNNGVEAMRDLIEKANLGTPGRHKVYILDEVHMLSKPAEATLLKTLEEPPGHVVFVLATTDPQKVSDTIRSRTQHLRFHLLPPDVLAEHVRWVAGDAGLVVSEEALDAAVTQGAGSARDALSALELIANAGGTFGEQLTFDEFVEALIDHDPGRALTAMAALVNAGHDPRTIAEGLVKHLRNGFLCLMAPELVQLPSDAADALAAQAVRLGPAALVGAIERLGEMLVELRHSPDPRVLIEVALVQLCRQRVSTDELETLAGRVAKLERAAAAPAATPSPVDPATGRAKLGGRAQQPVSATAPEPPASVAASEPQPAVQPAVQPAAAPADEIDLRGRWNDTVRPNLRGLTRALFAPVEIVAADGDVVILSAPNATHQAKCEQQVADVERALGEAAGRPIKVRWESASGADTTPVVNQPASEAVEEHHEPDDSQPVLSGGPSVLERLSEAFPGATLVGEDD